MRAMLIPHNGPPAMIDLPEDGGRLKALQRHVGGLVEVVALRQLGADLWANDNGKYECRDWVPGENGADGHFQPQINPLATFLARNEESIHPTDYIAGNVVMTGPPGSEGETTPVTADACSVVLALVELKAARIARRSSRTCGAPR